MPPFLLMIGLASASVGAAPGCDRFLVQPGPEQGWADAALVTKASHHETDARDLGTVLTGMGWRIVWARPADSENGVFFFRRRSGGEHLVDIWGGSGATRGEAARWAETKLGMPAPLARCFADRLVREGT